MKKIIVNLALLMLTTHLFANEPSETPTPLTQEETKFFGTLYWNKKNAASFSKGLTDTEIDFGISVLLKKIQHLQNAMLPENIRSGKNALMAIGGLGTILYGGLGSFLAYELYKKHYEFITGRFKNTFISESELKNLSSMRFSLKEKKYLRRFKAENIVIGNWWWDSERNQKRTQQIKSTMSRRDKEKLTYYALKETVALHKHRLLSHIFQPVLLITGAVILFLTALYGIIYHKENLQNQLEECKNLYRILKDEQELRLSLVKKSI